MCNKRPAVELEMFIDKHRRSIEVQMLSCCLCLIRLNRCGRLVVDEICQHVGLKRGLNGIEMASNGISQPLMRAVQRCGEPVAGAIHPQHIGMQISKVNMAGEMVLLHEISSIATSAFAGVKFSERIKNTLRLDLVLHC